MPVEMSRAVSERWVESFACLWRKLKAAGESRAKTTEKPALFHTSHQQCFPSGSTHHLTAWHPAKYAENISMVSISVENTDLRVPSC